MAIAGRVAIVPKGDWDNETQYTKLDMVRHNNISYTARQNNIAQEPTGVTDQYWMLVNDTSIMTGATLSANGKAGIVPQPMAGDNTKALFGDGTFKEIPLPTDMLGASTFSDGAHGLVPAPLAGDENKFLGGDGLWHTVSGGGNKIDLYEFEESPTHKAHALNDKLFFDDKPYHLTVAQLAASSLLVKPGNTGANIAEDLAVGDTYGVVGIPNT